MESLPEQLKKLKVLLVDDVAMNLEILSRQLTASGIQPAVVGDGFAALAELERAWHAGKPYDIVFLDQMMPGISGEELARRICSVKPVHDIKLVLVSSAGGHGLSATGSSFFEAMLEKPVRQHELSDCLIRVYSGRPQPASAVKQPARLTGASKPVALRILLAEDNRINQQFAVALLERDGHKVDIANNGLIAVEAVIRADYDIVLMDIQMPELDGLGATAQIRALPDPKCSIPIVAMTADAMSGSRAECLRAGMNDYISKPIQVDALNAILNLLTGTRKPTERVESKQALPADVPELPVLDTRQLDTIGDVLTQDQVRDLQLLYLKDTECHIAEVNALVRSGDLNAIARTAHIVVSTAGNIGAVQTSMRARQLEEACKRGERDKIAFLIDALNTASAAASHAIESRMKVGAPSSSADKLRA